MPCSHCCTPTWTHCGNNSRPLPPWLNRLHAAPAITGGQRAPGPTHQLSHLRNKAGIGSNDGMQEMCVSIQLSKENTTALLRPLFTFYLIPQRSVHIQEENLAITMHKCMLDPDRGAAAGGETMAAPMAQRHTVTAGPAQSSATW